MTTDRKEELKKIWKGDKFGRQAEAELLAAYIRDVASRNQGREDKHGYTIAVDAPYGHGKSFFLTRFAKHMGQDHPVAYINAWTDDVADDPLAALMATIEEALEPLLPTNEKIEEGLATLKAKAWETSKIVGTGLLKRALSLAIMEGGVEALEGIGSDLGDELSEGLGDDVAAGLSAESRMTNRIDAYKEARDAIEETRKQLARIVEAISSKTSIPLVIVIDELDRCRPTYAIKLLEQINHLFDVPGVVFVLGLNGDQFAKSVAGAYGHEFDGQAYLRRFINRNFVLKTPDLTALLTQLIEEADIDQRRVPIGSQQIRVFRVGERDRANPLYLAAVLAELMTAYGLEARDAFAVIDMLQTSLALCPSAQMLTGYLLPLIVCHIATNSNSPELSKGMQEPRLEYRFIELIDHSEHRMSYMDAARTLQEASRCSETEIYQRYRDDRIALQVTDFKGGNLEEGTFADPANYPKLIQAVGQFQQLDDA